MTLYSHWVMHLWPLSRKTSLGCVASAETLGTGRSPSQRTGRDTGTLSPTHDSVQFKTDRLVISEHFSIANFIGLLTTGHRTHREGGHHRERGSGPGVRSRDLGAEGALAGLT